MGYHSFRVQARGQYEMVSWRPPARTCHAIGHIPGVHDRASKSRIPDFQSRFQFLECFLQTSPMVLHEFHMFAYRHQRCGERFTFEKQSYPWGAVAREERPREMQVNPVGAPAPTASSRVPLRQKAKSYTPPAALSGLV